MSSLPQAVARGRAPSALATPTDARTRSELLRVLVVVYALVTAQMVVFDAFDLMGRVPLFVFGICQYVPTLVVLSLVPSYRARCWSLMLRLPLARVPFYWFITLVLVAACGGMALWLGALRPDAGAFWRAYPLHVFVPVALRSAPGHVAFVLLIGPFLHGLNAIGEEILWRGYLLDRQLQLGAGTRAYALNGLLWAVWHAPMIFLLGWDFPGHPVFGLCAMIVAQVAWSIFMCELRVRSDSLWPPIVLHATANAAVIGGYDLLVDPSWNPWLSPWGLLGGAIMFGYLLLARLGPWRSTPRPEAGGKPIRAEREQPRAKGGDIHTSVFEAAGPELRQELQQLVGAAWDHDYADEAVYRFDERELDWLLPPGHAFGVLARDGQDRLVGCELAFRRTVRLWGRTYRAYYVTLLTAHPDLRGQGVGQRVLHHLTREALQVRDAELLVSTFDAGHAGLPTVTRSLRPAGREDGTPALSLRITAPIRFWGWTRDVALADRYEPLRGVQRLALRPAALRLVQVKPAALAEGTRILARGREGSVFAGTPAVFGFDGSHSLAAMYASEVADTLTIAVGARARCQVAYQLRSLTRPGLPAQPVGQIQLVTAPGASPLQVAEALRLVNNLLIEAGCLMTIIAPAAMVSPISLLRAGFFPIDRRIRLALRGRPELIDGLRPLPLPDLFDVT